MRASLQVSIHWWPRAKLPPRVRSKLSRLLGRLAPVLNEYEAALFDMTHLASNGLEFLLPKIEVNLPLFEERRAFRLRMIRLDETQMFLETRSGDVVAEVFLR